MNQNRPVLIRDLSIFGQPVYLQVPRRQFYCRTCQKYFMFFLTWYAKLTIKMPSKQTSIFVVFKISQAIGRTFY
ncbi:transposase family protein [Microcoleus sp. BR0-C5]|uniref:transposase family protein n=1 Tax=Microcoleus sp. BR0-C5 TaxID=2818713 RepID=UPI004040A9FD